MSAPDTRKGEEEPAEASPEAADPGREAEQGRGTDRPGLDYVFKLSRVDPRSTLDFEDAADK